MKLFKVVQRAAKTWREYTNAIEALRKERDEARAQVVDLKRANKVYRTGTKEDLDDFVAMRDERDKALAEVAVCKSDISAMKKRLGESLQGAALHKAEYEAQTIRMERDRKELYALKESLRYDLFRTVCKERDDARAEAEALKVKLSVFTKPEDDAEALIARYRLKRNLGLSPDADNRTVAAAQLEALQRGAGSLAGAWTDAEAKEMFGPAEEAAAAEVIEAPEGRVKGWIVKRADGYVFPWLFTERRAAQFFAATYVKGNEAEALAATSNGRGWLTDHPQHNV